MVYIHIIGEKLNCTYRANVIRDLADSLGVLVPDFGVLSPEFDSDEGFDLLAPLFFLDADITHNYYEYLVVFFVVFFQISKFLKERDLD